MSDEEVRRARRSDAQRAAWWVTGVKGLQAHRRCGMSGDDDIASNTSVEWPAVGWIIEGCHCCAGISWGGDYPRECPDCKGGGVLYLHDPSGRYAMWPGGPFLGSRRALGPPRPDDPRRIRWNPHRKRIGGAG